GFAFPFTIQLDSSEATPRSVRGGASKELEGSPESRRLSAMCCGKAANHLSFSPVALLAILISLLAPTAFGQDASPSPSSQAIKVPSVAVDYRADTKSPMPSDRKSTRLN